MNPAYPVITQKKRKIRKHLNIASVAIRLGFKHIAAANLDTLLSSEAADSESKLS